MQINNIQELNAQATAWRMYWNETKFIAVLSAAVMQFGKPLSLNNYASLHQWNCAVNLSARYQLKNS